MSTMTLLWNGEFLDDFNKECLIEEYKYEGVLFWRFLFKNFVYIAEVRHIESKLSAVIDEFKVLFFMPKLGTHTCRINGKLWLIIKPIKDCNGMVLAEKTLDCYKIDKKSKLIPLIQDVFSLREIFGFVRSNESCIRLRQNGDRILVLSYKEGGISNDNNSGYIPLRIYEEWFQQEPYVTELSTVVRRLIGLKREKI